MSTSAYTHEIHLKALLFGTAPIPMIAMLAREEASPEDLRHFRSRLPYLPAYYETIENVNLEMQRSVLLHFQRQSTHDFYATGSATIFVYVFTASSIRDQLTTFWKTMYDEVRQWMRYNSRKTKRMRFFTPFLVFVEVCDLDPALDTDDYRRARRLATEIEIYSHLECGGFLYFQIATETDRAALWSEITKQALLQSETPFA
jgi:hypothetical protein